MKSLLPLLLLVIATPAVATDYTVLPGSTLKFSGSFQGAPFDGEFKQFDAQIRYDANDLASSKFDVSVDLASAVTGDSDRDAALPGEEFFNTAKFPKARFVSTSFRAADSRVIAEGTLTIKGASKPTSLAVTFTPTASGATMSVTSELNRLDFNVGSGEYADTETIGEAIKVDAQLKLAAK